MTLTPRLRKAINTASVAHRDHVRKGSGIPYVTHLFSVMYLLASVTDDEDVLIAGLLHDTLEDVPEHYSATQLEQDFGPRVLSLVRDLTKDDSLPRWKDRADSYLEHLEHGAHADAVLISVADKTHNLMSTLDDHVVMGELLWDRFNSTRQEQKWWYAQIHRIAVARLGDNVLNEQLGQLVAQLRHLQDPCD
ncbi:MAG: bifunctional (p)ppGpp synthetase/guanosine-3',5'-bis(diphosphate) 3'-pyrophosphohydrolase [Corynebacterium sp.]|uniref:HD domain-containing protein n=1 Tax=uncultured Corynebacterium sp. TaxID=159447 RepID=UPI00182B7FAC|nr:HD domain-containing protein [uncultured Corynebacterium sp.]NLZ58281.1 bifunctional (p)ppGpp synthetase/guanosine-3',5'-bis(diphosphate) 3'-pyrophosphohydrolase [Corynebacterium sp.]